MDVVRILTEQQKRVLIALQEVEAALGDPALAREKLREPLRRAEITEALEKLLERRPESFGRADFEHQD